MPAARTAGSSLRLGGPFARRLFIAFIAAAMLPLAVSDLLSAMTVTRVTEKNYARDRALMTRQVSREVFDRLTTGKTLMLAMAAGDAGEASGAGVARASSQEFIGLHTVFRNVARVDADGRVAFAATASDDLAALWRSAGGDAAVSAPAPRQAAGPVQVSLRLVPVAPPRVLLGASTSRGLVWVAEMAPAFLWSPLQNASEDSAWRVSGAQGRAIAAYRGDDFRPDAADPAAQADPDLLHSVRVLFLGAEFDAPDWRFEQWSPPLQVQWLGLALHYWLGLVAAATLLSITLAVSWQIRRTLIPLEMLREGTRRLAGGAAHTRVAVQGNDEFADLANAFNDMAGRIEAQFSALSGLAAIDNDILAGAPIQQVADRILRQAASQCPGCRVAISWLDASGDLNTAATVSTAEQDTAATRADRAPTGGWRREPLPAAARSRFAALAADTWYQAGSDELRSDPWLAWAAPGAATLAVLPVREQGRTQALICLAAAQPVPAAVLRPLRELRDRLAVAFAAWSRERELAYRATHDSLTGLANRSGLQEFLDAALAAVVSAAKAVNAGPEQPGASPARAFPAGAAADAASVGLALLFIDLDRFKDINDVLGHDAGDKLLCLAAERLLRGMPPGSLLSRPGGDEFVAVLPAFDEARAAALAALLVQGLAQPFALRGAARTIGASIGIAVAPAHGHERDTLMRRADAAMYAAKEGGRGRAMVFSADMDVRARDRLRVQSELPRAIANGEIAAWFQPRVRPSDLAITSAEALVRWQHPALGLLKPAAFIGFAEDSELIVQLGDRMLDQSLAQMARWRALGSGIGRISVNISTRQLAEGRLLDKVGAALERHGVPAHCLELEVTESVMAGDGDNFASQLAQLRALGTTIAMDDFGTGYSSMANLRNLPIDVMKIDRAFVKDLDKSGAERQGALAVIRAIVAMAKSMQLSLVAEGIETAAQAEVLRALDCEEFQGFLYAPPLPAAEFEAMLRAGVALRRAG